MSSPRRARALVVAAAAVVLLSGCFHLDMKVVVEEDGTASGSYVIATDRALLEAAGDSAEDVFSTGEDFVFGEGSSVQVEERPWEDGDLVGREFVFSQAPLDMFGEELTITHADGEYVLDGVLTAQTETGVPGVTNPDIRLAFTFPGDVHETTGTIDQDDPRTVRWTSDGTTDVPLHAVAADTPSAASWIRLAVVGGGGLLLLVVLVVVLVLLVRRSRRARIPYAGGFPVYAGIPPVVPGPPAPPAATWGTPAAPATPIAWQPDPPVGTPPGAVPHQPPTGPRAS